MRLFRAGDPEMIGTASAASEKFLRPLPARPARAVAHRTLRTLQTPTLIVQSTRDPFGTRNEVGSYDLPPGVAVHWLEDGNHDFRPPEGIGADRAAERDGRYCRCDSFPRQVVIRAPIRTMPPRTVASVDVRLPPRYYAVDRVAAVDKRPMAVDARTASSWQPPCVQRPGWESAAASVRPGSVP